MALAFPSVFVGVGEEVLGTLLDQRPSGPGVPRPTQAYLLTLPSAQLQDMWRGALARQREALGEAEEGSADAAALQRVLKEEMGTVDKFDVERSDRQYARRGGSGGAGH